MAFVLAVLNQKGGSGKTTLSAHLGRAAAIEGLRVLLVDTDRQGSLRDWHAADDGCGMDLVAADTASAVTSIRHVAQAYDLVIVDGMPSVSAIATATVKIADGVLIPIQPSPLDLWACNEIIEILQQRRTLTNGLPRAGVVVSRAVQRSVIERDLMSALPALNLDVLDARIHQRVIYPFAMARGRTVFESQPLGRAAMEMHAVFSEVKKAWL